MSTVLVTGGCGYIGCWACQRLLEAGHEVKVVDKGFFPSGVEYVLSLGVPVLEADIRDFDLADIGHFDAIVHLAGLSNDPSAQYNARANDEMNRVATQRLVDNAARIGCDRFIFASSASVYGFNHAPRIDEDAPINPLSYYAESKVAGEAIVREAAPYIGGIILRQATVMGWSPRHRNDLVVNAMVRSALTTGTISVNAGGEAVRPMVHVEDLADGYLRLLEAPSEAVVGQTFNVCHRRSPDAIFEGYTIACLALWIRFLLESRHNLKVEVVGNWGVNEGRSYDISAARLREAIGWEAQRGVTDAVDSIVAHRGELGRYDQNNIEWLKACEHGQKLVQTTGSVFV